MKVQGSISRAMMRRASRKSVAVGKRAEAGSYAALEELMDEIFEAELAFDTLEATYRGFHQNDARMPDMTEEGEAAYKEKLQGFLERMEKDFPEAGEAQRKKQWTADQLITRRIVLNKLQDGVERFDMGFHLMPVDMMNSAQFILPLIFAKMKFATEQDYQVYKQRLEDIPRYLAAVNSLCEAGLERGKTPPRDAVVNVPGQIDAFVASTPNAFLKPLDERFDKASGSAELCAEIEAVVRDKVLPAFEEHASFLREEYIPQLSEDVCMVTRCADGEAMYAYILRHHTTTTMSPEEIHEVGQAQVENITNTMREIAEAEGFGDEEDPIDAYRASLNERCVCETENDLLKHYKAVAMRIMPKLPAIVGKLPRTTFGVRPIPAYIATNAPAAYYEGPPSDLSGPGWFSLNTAYLESRKTYIAEALVLHEACPGHHLQIALSTENGDIPNLRKHAHYTAYIEGWGLYSEYLGHEMGMYDKPEAHFGRLVIEQMRACRLVVDTGMNALGWPRERAVQFMTDNKAGTPEDIEAETKRYVAIPGQACSYKLGEIKLKELRALAEDQLGDKFSLPAFHDLVLGVGSLPLTVLEEVVRDWIAASSQ